MSERFPLRALSPLIALLALALLVARFVQWPWTWETALTLPGLVIPLRWGTAQLTALLIAVLCWGGVMALLERHPRWQESPTSRWALLPHAVFPTVLAWSLEILLQRLPYTLLWWGVFALGLGGLFLVIVAEGVVLDPTDRRYAPAATVLTGLGFLALLLLAYSLHAARWRLVYLIPTLGGVTALVALRALRLRAPERWHPVEALLVAAVVVHPAAAWRYLPLSALSYALALTAVAYAATVYFANLLSGETPRQALTEPLVILGAFLPLVLWSLR